MFGAGLAKYDSILFLNTKVFFGGETFYHVGGCKLFISVLK